MALSQLAAHNDPPIAEAEVNPLIVRQDGVVAVDAGYGWSMALKADGTVVAWGDNSLHQTDVPAGLSNVVAIWQLRRSVSGGQVHASGLITRFFRLWWSYRVEIAAFWGVYWFLFAVTMVLGSHIGGWVLDALVLLAVFCRPVRRRVRGVFTRSRLRRGRAGERAA